MDGNTTEAERWLAIAEKLLESRDLHGTRTFAIDQMTRPLRIQGKNTMAKIFVAHMYLCLLKPGFHFIKQITSAPDILCN